MKNVKFLLPLIGGATLLMSLCSVAHAQSDSTKIERADRLSEMDGYIESSINQALEQIEESIEEIALRQEEIIKQIEEQIAYAFDRLDIEFMDDSGEEAEIYIQGRRIDRHRYHEEKLERKLRENERRLREIERRVQLETRERMREVEERLREREFRIQEQTRRFQELGLQARKKAEHYRAFSSELKAQLKRDGYLKEGRKVKMELDGEQLKINGKVVPDAQKENYLKLFERHDIGMHQFQYKFEVESSDE